MKTNVGEHHCLCPVIVSFCPDFPGIPVRCLSVPILSVPILSEFLPVFQSEDSARIPAYFLERGNCPDFVCPVSVRIMSGFSKKTVCCLSVCLSVSRPVVSLSADVCMKTPGVKKFFDILQTLDFISVSHGIPLKNTSNLFREFNLDLILKKSLFF